MLVRGIEPNGARPVVRFGDLRHTFATRLISAWSRQGEPVPHYLVLLSRYMGHKQFNATWWYVSPDSSSLRSAAQLFQQFQHNQTSQKPMIDSEDYYRQVKRYAEQLRNTNNADDIIRILDIVWYETRGLGFSDEVFSAQEQVKCAEQKIESLKSELEQLRGLVQTDQVTARSIAVDWTIFLNAKRLVPIGMHSL